MYNIDYVNITLRTTFTILLCIEFYWYSKSYPNLSILILQMQINQLTHQGTAY
jgi:hypothetical protein